MASSTTNNTQCLFEAGSLLNHVATLEMKCQAAAAAAASGGSRIDTNSFGHPKAPELHLCPIPTNFDGDSKDDKDTNGSADVVVVAMMAVTDRCVSAQLFHHHASNGDHDESSNNKSCSSGGGSSSSSSSIPVEVLVVDQGNDLITCATLVVLERPELSAADALIVADDNVDNHYHDRTSGRSGTRSTKSLMSGAVQRVSTTPPRVAVIVGTQTGRVVSIEYSVHYSSSSSSSSSSSALQLVLRNYHVGQQLFTYLEPLPRERLSTKQQSLPQVSAQRSRWVRRRRPISNGRQDATTKKTRHDDATNVVVPFAPQAGVTSLVAYSVPQKDTVILGGGNKKQTSTTSTSTTCIWIGFADGTGVRLHHAGFFPSVIQRHTELVVPGQQRQQKLPSLEQVLGQPLIKWQAHVGVPNAANKASTTTTTPSSTTTDKLGGRDLLVVVPIPKYHPTPLAMTTTNPFDPASWNETYALAMGMDRRSQQEKDEDRQQQEEEEDGAMDAWWDDYEAVVYNRSATMVDSFPTLVFYTSEDQYTDRFQSRLRESINGIEEEEKKTDGGGNGGGGGNPIAAIVGGIFGMFGGGGGKEKNQVDDENFGRGNTTPDDEEHERTKMEEWDPSLPFPAVNRQPIDLFAGVQIFDPPRQISQFNIDPTGDHGAFTDTLGRVSLVDLTTKQIVRMWKGYREASVHWCTLPHPNRKSQKPLLFLVIHSRQRRVVEVWQMTHGPRLKSLQVGREAQVISSREMTPAGYMHVCYIAYSNMPFSTMNQVERIEVSLNYAGQNVADIDTNGVASSSARNKSSPAVRSQDDATRMNRLQQLLGQTNVTCQSVDVYMTLQEIRSLEDLAISLDTIARTPALEEEMDVDGSSFQRLALSHSQLQLDDAIRLGGDSAATNPHVGFLAYKIAYYSQVANAYDALHRYETRKDEGQPRLEVKQPKSWGLEAAGWTSTYLKTSKMLVDNGDSIMAQTDPMRFYEFATCLVAPKKWKNVVFDEDNGRYAVYLSDSSRTRRDLVARIFHPLTSDVFSFSVVNQIFETLGIINDHEYKLKCFGEWFTSLSIKEATKKTVFASDSPAVRWLKDIISDQLDSDPNNDVSPPMESLYAFCIESEDLLRAFWLGVLCRQAVYEVAVQKEEQSYGKVDRNVVVQRWDEMLRKLRVCMLVSLRLHGNVLGACPISIKAVDSYGNFSVYQWLARDELKMSHKQPEIASLEIACRMSNRAFDPSKPEGDDPNRWKTVQRSCLSMSLGESERSEYMIDFDDDERLGALLLYFKAHNRGDILVAHRALLLGAEWGHSPSKLELLEDAIAALESLDEDSQRSIAFAIRLEMWQSHIRPIYRSMIAGFHDVPEITPDIIGPLIEDPTWLDGFSKHAVRILELVTEMQVRSDEGIDEWEPQVEDDYSTWPPARDCFLLQRYVAKNKVTDPNSLQAHQIMMYALRISDDLTKLAGCVPSFYDLFTPAALFHQVAPTEEEAEEKQHEYMQDAVVTLAKNYQGPVLESLSTALGDIDVLARMWDFDMQNVNTLFLLAMYEFGKDAAADDVLTKSSSLISVKFFVDEGVDIMVRRLHDMLHVHPTEEIKGILPALDADICEWVKDKAQNSEPLLNAKFDVKIGSTHLFGLRLLSLAASADIAKVERIQIHSLIVLSGTIVKALETSPGSEGANVMGAGGQVPTPTNQSQGGEGAKSQQAEEKTEE